ncbi:grpE protein homolog 2, mitochondrial isoform X1 [Ranitomeya imitator]|uniref:grpE protein homolog 2, mitochondrial isoform X1 n=1 Tax=Ranitomeya imitator TaxID=111125 RepID=UPI0037E90CA3
MAAFRMRAVAEQLRRVQSHGARHSRSSVCAYSGAAPQQRSSGNQTTGGDDQSYSVRSLERKTVKLEEEVRDLTELYNKAVEDSETVRNKTKKFVEDAKLFGIQSFSRDLVDVADLLEQAVEEAEQKGMKEVSETLSSIERKLQSIFTKHGLLKMTPMGGDYDPYDHEIVCHVPAEGRRPGSVATIQQDGYKLHGRTIRHAHVGIAVLTQE